jgi:hypothetical protein
MTFTSVYTETDCINDTPLVETKLNDILDNWDKNWVVMFDENGDLKTDATSMKQHTYLMNADITAGVAGQDQTKDVPYYKGDVDKIKTYVIDKVKGIAARDKRQLNKADVALIDAILQRIVKSGDTPTQKPQIDPANVAYAPGSKSNIGAGYKTDYVIKNGQMMTAKNAANS